jgi:hypothetical protein
MSPGNCPGTPEADLRIALRLVPVYIAKRVKTNNEDGASGSDG